MKGTIVLIFVLLATASRTGQWTTQSRHSPNSKTLHLSHLTLTNEFLLPSIFTVCGGLLALSLIAVGSFLWPKNKTVKKSGARTEYSLSYVTPLYVHRVTQARTQLASQRRVTQITGLQTSAVGCDKDAANGDDRELWRKRREKLRVKRNERRAKGPRIDPEELKRINWNWQLFYGFTERDLIHIENELENTVAKVPFVHSKKGKAIKFVDSIDIVVIEKENKGRRVKRSRKMSKHSLICDTECDSVEFRYEYQFIA